MWDLNRYVTRKHATMWRDVGLELKLEHSVLKGIEKDNPQDTTNCFKEVLDKWLRLTPSATWKELEIALTNVNRMQLVLDPVDDIYGETMNLHQHPLNVQHYHFVSLMSIIKLSQ